MTRNRGVLLISLAALGASLALAPAATGGGSVVTVEAGGLDQFDERVIATIAADGNLEWTWGGDGTTVRRHNVRQDDRLFYSGRPTNERDDFIRSVSAGRFRYYCERHGGPNGQGMSGRILVSPTGDGVAMPDRMPIRWATDLSTTGDQYDVRFRVDDGPWRIWRRNTATRRGVFGKNDNPVDFDPDKLYEVQGRSEKSANPKRRSGWSFSYRFGDTGI